MANHWKIDFHARHLIWNENGEGGTPRINLHRRPVYDNKEELRDIAMIVRGPFSRRGNEK